MKNKIKNVVCGTLLTVALALMMILTTVSTGLVSGGTNLKIAEAEELPRVTISFDANGGTGYMDDDYENAGCGYVLPECEFEAPEGKCFYAWRADGEETTYEPGEHYALGYYSSVTFYAVWEEVAVEEEPVVNPVMEATYNGTITVGEKLDLDKVSVVIIDENSGDELDGYDYINVESVKYFIENTSGMEVSYDRIYTNEYTFDNVGVIEIKVTWGADGDYMETIMTVEVVAEVVEEPAPETPEQPEIEEPVVEQPTEEVKPAEKDNNGLGLGAILGIVFGSLAVLGLGGSLLWAFVFRK